MRKTWIAGAFALAASLTAATAVTSPSTAQESGTVYYFGTHTKHTNISFVSEAEIETIHGSTHKMGGQCFLNFDDKSGKCSVTVPVDSLRTGIDTRDDHLRSDQWLDAEKYPDVELRSGDIELTATRNANVFTAKLKGTLTVHGVEKEREIDAKVTRLAGRASKLLGSGSWVRVQAKFDVRLSDHGIEIPNPEMVGPKVSQVWNVELSAFATTTKPGRR